MKINRDTISQLHKLTDDIVKAEGVASELLRTAQDRFNHVKETLMREGKQITVTRKVLWDEVFYLGAGDNQATQLLKQHHPEVFEAYKLQEDAAGKLQAFVSDELDMDFKKMRISDYIKLTEGIMDLKLDEKERGVEADGSIRSPIQDIK